MERKKKNLVVLGATGSIGRNTLEVCACPQLPVSLYGLAAARSWPTLARQAALSCCREVVIADSEHETELRNAVPDGCRVLTGEAGMIELCTRPEVDMVLCAITGTAGLKPVLAAIEAGKDIGLASKEILVAAGDLVMGAARRRGVAVIPVDSEHSAIFQCLQGEDKRAVKRLILTASGGPFRDYSRSRLQRVSWQQALAHPTWQMGPKITIDSATLMNKGLELIEARWLFDMRMDEIEVILHPQSIVHSMVEMIDGSVLAQMGEPDMRLPIQYALGYPFRVPHAFSALDLVKIGRMEFFPPRDDQFPALCLARQAGQTGGTMPAVLNAANEVAVAAFRRDLISFPDISELVAATMRNHNAVPATDLKAVLQADQWARQHAARQCRLDGCPDFDREPGTE